MIVSVFRRAGWTGLAKGLMGSEAVCAVRGRMLTGHLAGTVNTMSIAALREGMREGAKQRRKKGRKA